MHTDVYPSIHTCLEQESISLT